MELRSTGFPALPGEIRRLEQLLSASIAVYRLEAEFFGGRSDGKFGAPSVEVSLIQVLISAGDN